MLTEKESTRSRAPNPSSSMNASGCFPLMALCPTAMACRHLKIDYGQLIHTSSFCLQNESNVIRLGLSAGLLVNIELGNLLALLACIVIPRPSIAVQSTESQ